MKVLFFFPEISSGGVVVSLQRLTKYLVDQGIEITIATNNSGACPSAIFDHRVAIIYRGNGDSKLSFARKLAFGNYTHYIGVQAHNTYWLTFAKVLSFRRIKIISWEHSSPLTSLIAEHGKTWILHLLLKNVISFFVNSFFCVSKGAVSELKSSIPFFSHKVFYAPNLIYIKSIEDLRKTRSREDSTGLKFLSVGRLSNEKGLELAINALLGLQNKNWLYWIVGDGTHRKILEDICQGNTLLRERVKFLGWRDDVNSYFELADALLLPSYYEGMPTVLVEASLYGVPLIASDCQTGPSEIIKDGENGFLFEVGNINSMRAVINKFIKTRQSILNSINYVLDFSDEAAGKNFILLLNSVK